MQKTDSLIFDLDGTLWDASHATEQAWDLIAKEINPKLSVTAEMVRSVTGLPADECVRRIFGESALTNPIIKNKLDQAEDDLILSVGGELYPGVHEGLSELQQRYPLFIVSNCEEWYLNAFFKHHPLQDVFKATLCLGQTGRPKGENIKSIVKAHDLRKAIYVGDTKWDHEAAVFAQVDFIHAQYGFGKLSGVNAVGSFAELVRMF